MLNREIFFAALISTLLATSGCDRSGTSRSNQANATSTASITIDPLSIALAPHQGAGRSDIEIREAQQKVRAGRNRSQAVEQLGWLYVTKARESFDPGYYKLAEACADVLDSESPGCCQGLLLRGHVLENLHHFKKAEPLARELIARRGLAFDYALLGDALMEQGRLEEAAAAYQSMMDLRPDLHAYSRAAHLRWLKGDLEGAEELMQAAVRAGSSQDAEASAWVCTRLALYQFQSGKNTSAEHSDNMALSFFPNYPPALLLQGRMLLAESNATAAVEKLSLAARANPLPEYEWTLAEALRAAGRGPEAIAIEAGLCQHAAAVDPRTFSLYLATRGERTRTAVQLASAELQQREDIFTHDALAWALNADGRVEEAQREMSRALAEGTDDGRLYFHATVIAVNAGNEMGAKEWMKKAAARSHLLLPSEREQLKAVALKLQNGSGAAVASAEIEAALPPGN